MGRKQGRSLAPVHVQTPPAPGSGSPGHNPHAPTLLYGSGKQARWIIQTRDIQRSLSSVWNGLVERKTSLQTPAPSADCTDGVCLYVVLAGGGVGPFTSSPSPYFAKRGRQRGALCTRPRPQPLSLSGSTYTININTTPNRNTSQTP